MELHSRNFSTSIKLNKLSFVTVLCRSNGIADILSAYDDLIENNRRRMELLEEAARLLYQEWFVRLRFPGHEHVKIKDGVPEGWERVPLGNIAKVNRASREELPRGDRIYRHICC